LPIAGVGTNGVLGGVKIGNGLEINSTGLLSVIPITLPPPYELPIAGTGVTGTLGGVKIGDNLTINASTGLLSAVQRENIVLVGDENTAQSMSNTNPNVLYVFER
jgi:hypothetical protein